MEERWKKIDMKNITGRTHMDNRLFIILRRFLSRNHNTHFNHYGDVGLQCTCKTRNECSKYSCHDHSCRRSLVWIIRIAYMLVHIWLNAIVFGNTQQLIINNIIIFILFLCLFYFYVRCLCRSCVLCRWFIFFVLQGWPPGSLVSFFFHK